MSQSPARTLSRQQSRLRPRFPLSEDCSRLLWLSFYISDSLQDYLRALAQISSPMFLFFLVFYSVLFLRQGLAVQCPTSLDLTAIHPPLPVS